MRLQSETHRGRRPRRITPLAIMVVAMFVVPTIGVLASGQYEGPVNTTDGIAIQGYDPVAYHTLGTPTAGSAAFTAEWDGATWYFSSAEHQALFVDDPEQYAPHFGGYCAQAAAQNQVAEGDPELWTIEEGRLFLNYNARFQREFRSDLAANIAAADRNWPALRAGLIKAAQDANGN